jgi:hypothetical protein
MQTDFLLLTPIKLQEVLDACTYVLIPKPTRNRSFHIIFQANILPDIIINIKLK